MVGGLGKRLRACVTRVGVRTASASPARSGAGGFQQTVAVSAPGPFLGGSADGGVLRELCHELRTPLASLGALSRALVRKPTALDDAQRQQALLLIQSHVDHLAAMLDAIRDVADTLEPGRRLAPEGRAGWDVCLPELIEASAAAAGLPAERLEADVEASAVLVRTDAVALRRILTNLLENARRASADSVSATARRRDRSLEIVVADRGPGLPADAIAAREPDSGGLGLWIVGRLVDALGGSVGVQPRTGGGTVVRISLPLAA